MALQIRLYQDRRNNSTNYGKIYGQAANKAPIGIDELSEHMAKHNCPYSKGIIKAILTDMVSCVKELMLDGQPVKISDLYTDNSDYGDGGGDDDPDTQRP